MSTSQACYMKKRTRRARFRSKDVPSSNGYISALEDDMYFARISRIVSKPRGDAYVRTQFGR